MVSKPDKVNVTPPQHELQSLIGMVAQLVLEEIIRIEAERRGAVGSDQEECNPTNDLPPVLTIKDAATYLQRSTKTIERRIIAGKLRSYKEGREHRIRREWLLEYETSLERGQN